MAYKKKYSPEEKAVYKEQKQSEIDEMLKRIDEGVKSVFNSDQYKEYLKFASNFTNYSPHNTMLISLQRPSATLVASYGKWRKVGRYVMKGETGIAIFAPIVYNSDKCPKVKKGTDDEDAEKAKTVEEQFERIAFKKVYVYDISQTDGKDIPYFESSELTGDIDLKKKRAIFRVLERITGIKIEFSDIRGGAKGYYDTAENRIVIQSGMSDSQTLKTAFHETAHKLLHDPKLEIVTVKSPRNEKEVQAESVAFMVAERLGLDTSEYSFPYIASWSNGKPLEQLKYALKEIQSAAKQITGAIEAELMEDSR
ncbi:MAG: ImmA/IrrE family metallo-endopeptidase [Ruminococcaceae bacterium]|nr:ImmA/IrrE family metallo-endopeptidase [Oscillospiraceae bacterium]